MLKSESSCRSIARGSERSFIPSSNECVCVCMCVATEHRRLALEAQADLTRRREFFVAL